MWHRDGWDVATRLGILTAHAAVGAESELRAMAPDEVGIHASRVYFAAMGPEGRMEPTIPTAPVRAFAEPPFVDDSTESLAAAPLDAIGFAFTSSGYVIGADGEAEMVTRLEERTGGIPVTTSCAAATAALRLLGVQRLALVDPPWLGGELNSLGSAYFRAAGVDVVHAASAALPSDQRRIEPEHLFEWIRRETPDTADGIFIGGNGFRAVGVIEALEAELDRPVVTANQGLLWRMLRLAGSDATVTGYGQLFALSHETD
jgi:maleate isomerase